MSPIFGNSGEVEGRSLFLLLFLSFAGLRKRVAEATLVGFLSLEGVGGFGSYAFAVLLVLPGITFLPFLGSRMIQGYTDG